MECLFCKIIDGQIPSKKIYENDYVYAFWDINPVAPIHIIIVPKHHIESANDIDEFNSDYIKHIFEAIPNIAEILDIKDDGYRIISNIGKNGGQTIKHLHFHMIGGTNLGEKLV